MKSPLVSMLPYVHHGTSRFIRDDPKRLPTGYQLQGCGYCGSRHEHQKTSPSFFAESSTMTPEYYQLLADRGWRRSGTTYYKPDQQNSCCPPYSIRLDASKFKASSGQRKAMNSFNRYIRGSVYTSKAARLSPKTKAQKYRRRHHFNVLDEVHAVEYSRLPRPADRQDGGARIEPAHQLDVTLEPDEMTEEKYKLFAEYQRDIHKDPPSKISRDSFTKFLCSGLPRSTDETGKKLGSYHQCYRVDGRLVAFAVLDLLPHAVSSVYVVYATDVQNWEYGKLSALREIALASEGDYKWYYMGYYIHNCVKMKYKADYRPQYVLDVASLQWYPLDQTFWDAVNVAKVVTYQQTEHRWEAQQGKSSSEKSVAGPRTIWKANMAGIPTVDELIDRLPTSDVQCTAFGKVLPLHGFFPTWSEEYIKAGCELQTLIAELCACVGLDLAREIAVDVSPFLETN